VNRETMNQIRLTHLRVNCLSSAGFKDHTPGSLISSSHILCRPVLWSDICKARHKRLSHDLMPTFPYDKRRGI
jgi:hypothetical protein